MFKRIDESERLSDFINWISTVLSERRGLPMVAGVVLVVLSGVCLGLLLPVLVITDQIGGVWLWFCFPLLLLYPGLLLAFIGLIVSAPLGEGYRDES